MKVTITLGPTERIFGRKAVDEHCSRESKYDVNTLPEHFQESACERTESAYAMLPSTAQLGYLDNVTVVSKTHLHTSLVRSLIATAGLALARKETSHGYPRTFAASDGTRTHYGEKK